MIEYRIREIEYGNGIKKYQAQMKNVPFSDIVKSLKYNNMFSVCVYSVITWVLLKYCYMDIGSEHCMLRYAEFEIQQRKNRKLSKQIKNKTYIKIND